MSIAKYLAKLAQGVDSQGQLSVSSIGGVVDTTPTITAIAYPGDDTATDPAGGQTITLTGTNFANGAKVIVNGATAGVVTVVNSTQITFVAPANPTGSYILYVVNANGSTAIAAPGIQYSTVPIFSTAAGSLGTLYETTSINTVTAAASDSTITYSIQSGTLPSGVTLNSSTGTITGTSPLTAASTTYTFTVRATDGQQQDGTRQFSLTINPDVITWANPTSGGTVTAYQGISTVIPITTTTGSGSGVVFSASGVPSGMALSGNTFTGTPITLGSSTGTLTGTTVASNRTSQITFTWTISVLGDTYWPDTTVLLTGTAPSGIDTFVADSSLNNNQITVVGDTRPSKQNPYQAGYYSLYTATGGYYQQFNGNAGFPSGTQDFTVEFWFNKTNAWNSNAGFWNFISGTATGTFQIYYNNVDNAINVSTYGIGTILGTTVTTIPLSTWHHLAVTRSGNTWTIWLNGVSRATVTDSRSLTAPLSAANTGRIAESVDGYVSNLRIVRGQALYSGTFTPGTAPLTTTAVGHTGIGATSSITGTVSLLTCQSNRYLDNSSNNVAIAPNAQTATNNLISAFNPFGALTNTYGSAYFDGTGDYTFVSSQVANPNVAFGTGDFTIEFWMNPSVLTSGATVLDCRPATTNGLYPTIYVPAAAPTTIRYLTNSVDVITSAAGVISINAWHHIALARSSGSTKLFVNGIQVGSTYTDTNAYVGGINRPVLGASGYDFSSALNGYISNLRVVNGTAVYTANFTPPTQPLTAVTNTSLLTLQTAQPTSNSMFVDNGPAANLVNRFGNSTQGSFNPYGSGHSIYVNGGGGQGWLQPSGVYAKTGGTTSGYVNLTGAFTFECWVYMTAGGRNAIFGESGGSAYSYAPGIGIFDTANAVSVSLNPGLVFLTSPISGYGGNFVYGSGLGFPTLNKWTHVAMCRDASNNWHFYMDGVKGTTANANSLVSANVAMPANNGPAGSVSLSLTMFNWDGFITGGNSTSMSAGFNGYLNDVRLVEGTALYTGASLTVPTQPLTSVPGTIVLLGQDNKYTNFANDKGITFTPTSVVGNNLRTDKFSKFNTSPGSKTPISYSNYFDGTGDYFSTPISTSTPGWNIMAPSGSGGGTVETWIYRTNNTAGSSIPERIICGCLNIGAAYTGWYLAVSSTGQLSIKGYITGNAAGPTINSGAGLVALNTWSHIAVSCVNGAVTFYIDGVSYSGGTMPATWLINNTATATMVGDAYPTWNSPFIGYISNLHMINNTALYTGAALTVPATPLTTTANTTLLTCQDSTFKDNSANAYVLTGFGDARPAFANPFGFTATANIPYSPTANTGSVYFDGTGDWLTLPHSPALTPTGDFTIEFWAYPTSVGGTQEWYAKGNGIQIYISGSVWNVALSSANNTAYFTSGGIGTPKTNVWQHVAVYRIGTAYYGAVDGKVVTLTASASSPNTGTDLQYVGASAGLYPAFGYISDLRTVSGTSMYTANSFVPPLSPLSAHKNAVLQLTMDKAAIIDATVNRDFETVGDARLITESAYNGVYYSNYFDGTGDYLTVPANTGFDLGTGNFTIECWFYYTVTPPASTLYDYLWGLGSNNVNGLALYIQGGVPKIWNGSSILSTSGTISATTWYHIAVVKNTSTLTVYLNGTSIGSVAFSSTLSGGGSTGVNIARWINAADPEEFNGHISNFRIVKGTAVYTANFTPSTIPLTAVANTQLLTCQSNSFKDNSTNNFAITKAGDVAIKSFNPFKRNTNTSMYFDGTGDYIYAPTEGGSYNFGSAANFTIETWAYPITTGTGKGIFQISATAGGLQASVSTTLAMAVTATNAIEMYANGTYYTTAAAKLPLNTWTHLAIVRSSGVTKLYINGVLETSIGTAGSITDTTIYPNTALVVGGYYSTSYLWNGYVEDFRITKGTARYTANFTPAVFKLPNK